LTEGADLAAHVKALALEAGYDACGITSADPFEEYARAIEKRIERFPEAAGLYEPMRKRADPREKSPWARSIAACVRSYGKYAAPPGLVGRIGRNYLFDRRNERNPDAGVPGRFGEALKSLGLRARRGGCPDRWAAARAGVAAFGRNCFAISPRRGSWINVETWLLDAELSPDEPTLRAPCPEGCEACRKACPTGAITGPYEMRMDRCVAYLTYGDCGEIAPELRERMGGWIYGCDRCQEVCPLNAGKWEEREAAPWLEEVADLLRPEALAEMDEKTYREVVHPLFWYIDDDAEGLERWRRNAKRALLSAECGMRDAE
jgi:epoxyqueuosine reductase